MGAQLTFQVVPSQAELQARIPAGRAAVFAKDFVEPAPAFGPGSVEHAARKVDALEDGEAKPVVSSDPYF
jgi:hypothetical protein